MTCSGGGESLRVQGSLGLHNCCSFLFAAAGPLLACPTLGGGWARRTDAIGGVGWHISAVLDKQGLSLSNRPVMACGLAV